MKGYMKHSGHCYTVANQNAFNQALYDFYSVDSENPSYTKKEVRKMVQNWPESYPITIVIVDQSFECSRVYIETFRMDKTPAWE